MKPWITKTLLWSTLAVGFVVGSAFFVYPAVMQLAGLAVAQADRTSWRNVQDAANGDNLTDGILAGALMLWDQGALNFDPARATTPSDAFTNPTGALTTWGLNAAWDSAASQWKRNPGINGVAAAQSSGNTQSPIGIITSQTVSAANTAVVVTITGATGQRAHVNGFDARCSAGTSSVTIATSTGPTTIYSTGAAEVTTTNFSKEFSGAAISSPNLGDSLTVTLAACGAANTGTIAVRGGRGV